MVVASACSPIPNEKTQALENNLMQVPIIDISAKDTNRSEILKLILSACQEYGFFKVINHGVSSDVIGNVEQEGLAFFTKPSALKLQAGPPNPLGYGSKKIGRCGDEGEIEYLLLSTDPQDIFNRSETISHHPKNFSAAMNDYIAAVRGLASKLLDMIAESLGLEITEKTVFSKLITDPESDSLIRLNYYPTVNTPPHHLLLPHKDCSNMDTSCTQIRNSSSQWIGFGDHTDPQMLTLLRSNDVGGLQICSRDGVWVPVTPDPAAFCVNVGDVLQVMTNGSLMSVRHRVVMNTSYQTRMSIIYFASPPPNALITCLPKLVTPRNPPVYKPFTWLEMKKVMYGMKLADSRLDHFKIHPYKDEDAE
ncbi:hypothetical protein QQ045_025477 [Rhodiola kirilowii]